MGLSLVASGLIYAALPATPWRPLVVNLGYTMGFLIVILGRQQLFTENTVTAILPLLDDPDKKQKIGNVVRLWIVVLVTNVVGTGIFAFGLQHTAIFGDDAKRAFLEIGIATLAYDFGTVFLKGIVAGWIIALLVWLLPSAEGSRVAVIIILTYVIGLGNLSHVIAGSGDALYAVAAGATSWSRYALGFLVPSLLGNSLGGVLLVSLLNYAQVAVKSEEETTP